MSEARFQIIYLEITNLCNMSCDFCPSDSQTRKKGFMDTSVAKEIISEIAEYNLSKCITLHIMGEPLLHRDVVELCRFAEDLGIYVRLLTNGILLNENLNNMLFSTGLSSLEISFRTPGDFAFKTKSRSKSLTFEDYKSKIKQLLANKIETNNRTKILIKFFKSNFLFDILSPIKTKHLTNAEDNLAVMKELREYCLKKAKQMGKNTSKYKNTNLKSSVNGVRIFDDIYIHSGNLFSFFLSENMQSNSSYSKAAFGGCDTFRRDFGILSNGDVTTCCLDYNGENVVGNIHEQKLVDILALERTKSIRKHFDRYHPPLELCKRCLGGPNIFLSTAKQVLSITDVLLKTKRDVQDINK